MAEPRSELRLTTSCGCLFVVVFALGLIAFGIAVARGWH